MDLNYIYHRRQISLMRAARAACGPSRAAHEGLARLYLGVIDARKADACAEPGHPARAAASFRWFRPDGDPPHHRLCDHVLHGRGLRRTDLLRHAVRDGLAAGRTARTGATARLG
jgi:hypothetical protein